MSSSSTSTGSMESGNGFGLQTGGDINKMTFGFFDDFNNEKVDDQTEVPPELISSAIDQSTNEIKDKKKNVIINVKNINQYSKTSLPERTNEYSSENNDENDDVENDNEVIIIPMKIMSLQDIVNNARKFCREKYVH